MTTIVVMSTDILPLRDVKARFSEVVDEVYRTHQRVTVTRKGRPVVVLVSPDDLESLEATLEVLMNPDLMRQIRESREAIDRGEPGIPVEDVIAEFKARTKRGG
jgi:antitoxin YefM